MDITEKVAYLKGLIEGLGYSKSTNEGKAILAIVDVLDEIALTVSDLEEGMELMSEQLDEMDDDISELQDDIYDEDDDEDDDFDFDGELYEVTCPMCDNTVCIDEDMLDEGEIICPNCGEPLEFDLDGGLEGCCCEDCDCHEDDEN